MLQLTMTNKHNGAFSLEIGRADGIQSIIQALSLHSVSFLTGRTRKTTEGGVSFQLLDMHLASYKQNTV